MNTKNKAAKRYLARVNRHTICSARMRKQICESSREWVYGFAEENPEAEYADFIAAFGEPQDYAEDALSVLDEQEILAAKRRRKAARVFVIAGIVAVFLIGALLCFLQWQNAQQIVEDAPVFYVESGTAHTITQEEFERRTLEKDG